VVEQRSREGAGKENEPSTSHQRTRARLSRISAQSAFGRLECSRDLLRTERKIQGRTEPRIPHKACLMQTCTPAAFRHPAARYSDLRLCRNSITSSTNVFPAFAHFIAKLIFNILSSSLSLEISPNLGLTANDSVSPRPCHLSAHARIVVTLPCKSQLLVSRVIFRTSERVVGFGLHRC